MILSKFYKYILFANILLFMALFLQSCDLEQLTEENEHHIDEEKANIIAENILFAEEVERRDNRRILSAQDFSVRKEVESITPLENDQGDNLLYVINYEEEAFVILSADKRVEPILAHSDSNRFDVRAEIFNPGLANWVAETMDYIEFIQEEDDDVGRVKSEIWDMLLEAELDVHYLGADVFCDEEEGYVEEVGPHLDTKWGQGCGYNDKLDNDCTSDPARCYRYPTGCVATAMAQVANFWDQQYENANGSTVIEAWDDLPDQVNSEGESEQLARRMQDMGDLVGMDYDCDGSGASSGDAYDEFVDNFGFTDAKENDLESNSDYDLMIDNIEDGYPVYLRGCDVENTTLGFINTYEDCHAWIADGTSEHYHCDGEVMEDTFKIHMNWGWNGNQDGEFTVKGKDEGSFEYDREMIYDIYN